MKILQGSARISDCPLRGVEGEEELLELAKKALKNETR